ncbi:MAG: hypothetical protein ACXWF8_05080 [Methylobacter sp.]
MNLKNGMKNDDQRLEALGLCENAIYPYGKPDDNQMEVNLDDCKEWSILIQQALTFLQITEWVNL